MATYYVQPNGADSNTGLGPSNANAWRTAQKALGATGIGSGDTLYIAPGTYREAITIGGTYSATTTVIGDRTASQFSGISAGYVRITGLASDALDVSTYLGVFTTNGKSNLSFDSIWFEHRMTLVANTSNCTFIRCLFTPNFQPTPGVSNLATITLTTTGQSNILFDKCYIVGGISVDGSGNNTSTRFNACFINASTVTNGGIECTNSGAPQIYWSNCTIFGGSAQQIFRGYSPPANTGFIYNCLIVPSYCSPTLGCGTTNCFVENYNAGYINRAGGVLAGANTKQLYHRSFIDSPVYINPVDASFIPYTPLSGDSLIGAGSASFTYGTDFFGNAWANPPSIGAMELKTYSTIGAYNPTERNASTITIAPGSTSQSIELYLGATGLAFNTSGLQAYYIRNRSAPVAITLVTQTATGAWTSGGFAEISSSLTPGVYRLDVPNAAFASGATDVTLVVRGAAGTNGAVVTVTLSAGGLSSTETAQAVWNATASSYNSAGSMGEAGQRLTGYSLAASQTFSTTGSVGSVTGAVTVGTNNDKSGYSLSSAGNTSAAGAVWNSARSSYTTAGTFGQYVNAELVTPVTQSALVRMGPYEVKADGLGASDPLDIQKGAQHGVDIQCVDGNGNGIDITSATVTAKVYNSGGSLVDTYSCTATYAADGRATFTIDTTVTNTPGTYTATITRTTGASDTQVFGPLRIYVRDI